MKNYLFSAKIKKRVIFGLVFGAVFLCTVCANRTNVYAQDRLKWIFDGSGFDIPISVRVTENSGESYVSDYNIEVVSEFYFPRAFADMPYDYPYDKQRVDRFFEIIEGPEWLKIDSATGQLTGTPSETDIGTHIPVILRIVNSFDYSREEKYRIDVKPAVDYKEMSLPPARIGENYSHQLPKNNTDDLFEKVDCPAWMSLNSETGKLLGKPTELRGFSSPAVADNGTIYIADSRGRIYAVAPDGTELWRHSGYEYGMQSPVIGKDGTLYFGDERFFYAIDPVSGEEKWAHEGGVSTTPAIGFDGTIYYGSGNGFVNALNPDGTHKWRCMLAQDMSSWYKAINSSPAIGPDGTIYVGGRDSYLYAINPWGTIKWKFEVDHFFGGGSLTIGKDGTIYASPSGQRFYAINSDGTLKWENSEITNNDECSPVISADGSIYIGNGNGSLSCLYCANTDGSIKWKYPVGGTVHSTPLIGTGGIVYFSGPLGNLYAFNPDGTIKWKYEADVGSGSPLSMSSDGTLYLGGNGLYAFNTDSNGYQEGAQWPNFMHNNTRSIAMEESVWPELHTVSGRISLPDSHMNGGIAISAGGLTTFTLADGSYSLDIPDGKYSLYIDSDSATLPTSVDFVVNGSDVINDIIGRKYKVSGRITDNGAPYGGIPVSIDGVVTVTDENGMYSLEVYDKQYTIRLGVHEYSFPDSRDFVVNGADTVLDDFEIVKFLWEYEIGDSLFNFPFFETDGSIRVFPKEANPQCIYNDGTFRESFPMIGDMIFTPSQSADGTFYVPGSDNLAAWTPSGGIKWKVAIEDGGVETAPAIGQNGTLYIGSKKHLYAINSSDGSVRWSFPCGRIYSTPSIAQDGTIYFSSFDFHVYALNPDGTLKWKYKSTDSFVPTPAIGSDGAIYVGGHDESFHALNPDGTLRWKYNTEREFNDEAVIDKEGTIYVSNESHNLYAIKADGILKWTVKARRNWINGSIVITEQNKILGASAYGELFLINTDGTLVWHRQLGKSGYYSPTLTDDGTLYMIMNETYGRQGVVRAYSTGIGGYQKAAPWPCAMGNNRRTSSASDMITSVEQEYADESAEALPSTFALGNNYPNPFNSSTTISYSLPKAGYAKIIVFSATGQKVATLLDEYKEAGTHSVLFDSKNLASGVYFYRMEVPGYTGTLRMLLIK